MGRAISITAFSWAWARGQTGATATDGVSIASAAEEEEGTLGFAETADTRMQPIGAVIPRRRVATVALMLRHEAAPLMLQRTVPPLTPADRMEASDTSQ